MHDCRTVVSIGPSAFQSSALTKVVIPTSVTIIDNVMIAAEQNNYSFISFCFFYCSLVGLLQMLQSSRSVSADFSDYHSSLVS